MDQESRKSAKRKASITGSPDLAAVLVNSEYIEALYEQWKKEPDSLEEPWRMFFQGFEMSMCPRSCMAAEQARKQSSVASLIYAYRSQGHVVAQLDPL